MTSFGNIQTISYQDSVESSSKKVLVSPIITTPYLVRRIRASFPPGVNRLLKLRYYVIGGDQSNRTSRPTGTNLLQSVGQVDYITGDDSEINIPHQVLQAEANTRVAVYAVNEDVDPHTIDTQVTIQFIERVEDTKNEQ